MNDKSHPQLHLKTLACPATFASDATALVCQILPGDHIIFRIHAVVKEGPMLQALHLQVWTFVLASALCLNALHIRLSDELVGPPVHWSFMTRILLLAYRDLRPRNAPFAGAGGSRCARFGCLPR